MRTRPSFPRLRRGLLLAILALLFFVTAAPLQGFVGAAVETVIFILVMGLLGIGLREFLRRRDRP